MTLPMASAVSGNQWPLPYTLRREVRLHHPLGSIAFWEASRGGSAMHSALLVLPRQGLDHLPGFETWTEAFEGDLADAARLDHPAILRVRDRGRAGHIPFAELERFSGVSLREAWPIRGAGNGLPALTAVFVMARLSAAVHHLYRLALEQRREAVVHLSDGLVCCGVDGDVHLLPRFSRVYDDEAPSFDDFPRVLGIPPADEHPSVRGLVFWLGSALYYLAVGEMATGRARWLDVDQLTRDFPLPSASDPRLAPLDPVIAKATHKKPAYRYEDAGRFAAALEELLQAGLDASTYRAAPWTLERARAHLAERVRGAMAVIDL